MHWAHKPKFSLIASDHAFDAHFIERKRFKGQPWNNEGREVECNFFQLSDVLYRPYGSITSKSVV